MTNRMIPAADVHPGDLLISLEGRVSHVDTLNADRMMRFTYHCENTRWRNWTLFAHHRFDEKVVVKR